jgi:hypothetical protein
MLTDRSGPLLRASGRTLRIASPPAGLGWPQPGPGRRPAADGAVRSQETLGPEERPHASGLTFTSISRHDIEGVAAGQPPRWTIAEFVGDIPDPDDLAARFAHVLDSPGWYIDFRNDDTVWVVFPRRVFTFARGDQEGRRSAVDYALDVGVPLSQTDWGN